MLKYLEKNIHKNQKINFIQDQNFNIKIGGMIKIYKNIEKFLKNC